MAASKATKSRTGAKPGAKRTSAKSAARSSEDFQRVLKSVLPEVGKKPLVRLLDDNGLQNPIILLGQQQIRARRIIDWIRQRFFAEDSAEYLAYFGSELQSKKALEPIAETLLSPSLFSKESLLVIYDSNSIKAPIAKELAALLQRPAETTLVVLVSEDSTKKTSLAGVLGTNASRITLSELSGSALQRWLEKEAKQLGTDGFAAGAARQLVQYFGSDTTQLSREVEKLALLTEPMQKISVELVEQLSYQNPEVTSFALVHKIARRQVTAASLQALSLIDQGLHPMQISFFLSRCIRMLIAQRQAEHKDQLSSELSNYWFSKNLQGLERSFPEREARYCLEQLRSLDFQLKDSALNDRMALSLAVQRLALRETHAQKQVRPLTA